MILDAVIDVLVSIFDAALSVDVYDGPNPIAANKGDFVLVGSTGEEEDGATVEQEPSDLGPGTWLDESGEVICSAWSWTGSDASTVPARRAAALSYVDACSDAIAANRSLGGVLGQGTAVVTGIRYQTRVAPEGTTVRVLFTVAYQTLNT